MLHCSIKCAPKKIGEYVDAFFFGIKNINSPNIIFCLNGWSENGPFRHSAIFPTV